MARPTTKDELLAISDHNYQKLISFINDLDEDVRNSDFPAGTMNRNVRDVLAHLYHWHLLFFGWYEVGMNGKKPAIPAEGYTWKTTPDLNRWIQTNYSDQELTVIREKLDDSHSKITDLVNKHTNEELFEKKRFKWTGSTSLGAYLIGSTSSHYDWAFKLIKRATK